MFKNSIRNFYNKFLNLIYSENCIICSCAKTENLLCKSCLKDVHYLSFFAHKIYKGISIFSAGNYDGTIKKLIHLLKFQHKKRASIPLANILYKYFKELNLNDNYIVVYPNTFCLRKFQRGYNHSYLIAKEFSKLTELDILENLILKIKSTKPQYKAKNRFKNIKDSFKINPKLIDKIKNKNILLIDDITTSGATLEEILNRFLDLGINNIICLTIAKAIK